MSDLEPDDTEPDNDASSDAPFGTWGDPDWERKHRIENPEVYDDHE